MKAAWKFFPVNLVKLKISLDYMKTDNIPTVFWGKKEKVTLRGKNKTGADIGWNRGRTSVFTQNICYLKVLY